MSFDHLGSNPAEYLFDHIIMLMRGGKRAEAYEMVTELLRQQPRHADAWALRARLEAESGRAFNAMMHHGIATQLAPERYDLWANRGIDGMAARMLTEAEDSFKRSLALKETYEGHLNYGNLLSGQMRIDEAVEHFKAAEKIGGPINPQIYANLGVALIGQGKWKEGYHYYRHRFNAPGFPPRPRFDYPIWHGEPLAGKTILLYVEQGLGDEILGLRWAKPVKDMGARVVLSVRPLAFRLAREVGASLCDAVIIQYDEPPWKPDFMCALLDVPGWIGATPETVPLPEGYLEPEDRNYKLQFPEGFKVGICWASGRRSIQPETMETAKQKSLAFKDLLPLKRHGVTLINLQKEHDDKDALREHGVFDAMAGVTDLMDTAWVLDQLDLVVTVDTAVAHLAGALGKPVWNLVRFDAMWPWMQEDGKTCWYDSMTVYRQPRPYDWQEPLKRLMADFDKLMAERAQKAA